MSRDDPALAALIGSRICHDLASPLGAVANGLELLSMTTPGPSAELSLMQDSLRAARAMLEMVRLAFGRAGADEIIGAEPVQRVLAGYYADKPRLTLLWQVDGPLPRPQAQIIALGCLAVASSLPRGGTLQVGGRADSLCITARGDSLSVVPDLWEGIRPDTCSPVADPRMAEFGMLRDCLHRQGLHAWPEVAGDRLSLAIEAPRADPGDDG